MLHDAVFEEVLHFIETKARSMDENVLVLIQVAGYTEDEVQVRRCPSVFADNSTKSGHVHDGKVLIMIRYSSTLAFFWDWKRMMHPIPG